MRFIKFLNAVDQDSWNWVSKPVEHSSFLPLLAEIAKGAPRVVASSEQALRHQTWDRKWEKFSQTRSVSMPGRVSLEKGTLPAVNSESKEASYMRGTASHAAKAQRGKSSAPAARSTPATGWRQALVELKVGQKPAMVGLGNYKPSPEPSPKRKYVSPRLPEIKPAPAQKPLPRKQSVNKHRPKTGGRQLVNPVML